ncbi:hypothetical protein CBL_08483 [Carabus blaptoides fortunei]
MEEILGQKRNINRVIFSLLQTEKIAEPAIEPNQVVSTSMAQHQIKEPRTMSTPTEDIRTPNRNKILRVNILRDIRNDRREYYKKHLEIEEKKSVKDSKNLTEEELAKFLEIDENDENLLELDSEDSEEEILFESDHDSNTEQEISEKDSDSNSEADEVVDGAGFFTPKDKVTKWKKIPFTSKFSKTRSRNLVKIFPGPKATARNTPDEITAFHKLIDIQMIDSIVFYTNLYIGNKREESNYSRIRDAKSTTRNEILASIGLLYLAGMKKTSHTNFQEL